VKNDGGRTTISLNGSSYEMESNPKYAKESLAKVAEIQKKMNEKMK